MQAYSNPKRTKPLVKRNAMHLYHGTSRDNRESILEHGLVRPVIEESIGGGETYYNGVFFHTEVSDADTCRESIDTWQVDVAGLKLERDTTTEHDDSDPWMVCWDQDIEPWRLKLLTVGVQNR